MAKLIDVTVPVSIPTAAARARLADPEVMRTLAMGAGAVAAKATFDSDVITIVRTFEVPEAARVMLRASTIDVSERRTWQGSAADIEITVHGVQVSMVGRIDIKSTGSGCLIRATGTVTAHMGFASPLIEGLLRDRMSEAFHAEIAAMH